MARWDADGVYRFDRVASARGRLRHRHAAADRQRLAPRRPRLLLHPHRRHRALPADARARPCSIRWDGTTTACRPSAASRTTTASAAIPRCRTTRRSRRPTSRPNRPISVSRPNFIELCTQLTLEDEKAFEALWRYLGLVGRLVDDLRDHRPRLAEGLAARVPAPAREGPGVSARSADAVGRGFPHGRRPGRARGSRAARARITASASRGPTAGSSRSTRRVPSCIPACVALVAHPDDERYKPLFGQHVKTPLFGVPVPVVAHPLANPEKGTGIAMICTFGDLTDVTWWRELNLPVRAIIKANGTLKQRAVGPAAVGRRRRGARPQRDYDTLIGLSAAKARTRIVELLKESGDLIGEPTPDHARGEVLREGRSAARDRHQPAVVLPYDDVPRAADRARAGAGVASAVHAGALRELGERPQRRLVRQPAAVLRRAVPGVVSDFERRHDRLRPPARAERTHVCPSIRRPTCLTATPSRSAASPAASSAIPTSWTRGRHRR